MLATIRQLLHLEFPWTCWCRHHGESTCSCIFSWSSEPNNNMLSLCTWTDIKQVLLFVYFDLSWTWLSWWWPYIGCMALLRWSQTLVAMTIWGMYSATYLWVIVCRAHCVLLALAPIKQSVENSFKIECMKWKNENKICTYVFPPYCYILICKCIMLFL